MAKRRVRRSKGKKRSRRPVKGVVTKKKGNKVYLKGGRYVNSKGNPVKVRRVH